MKFVSTITLLFLSNSCFATFAPLTMEQMLDCSISVIHGKVISGEILEEEFKFRNSIFKDKYGRYKVEVIENISGEEFKESIVVGAEFSAIGTGLSYTYPTPGLEYIFIIWKGGEGFEISPYHLPLVNYYHKYKLVNGGQHSFLESVSYFYLDEKFNYKEGMLKSKWNDEGIHPHVINNLGYKYSSYLTFINKAFGNCSNDER